MRYVGVPILPGDDAETTLVLLSIWDNISRRGLVSTIWYDGSLTTPLQFLNVFRAGKDLLPMVVWDSDRNEVAAMTWLTGLHGRHAVIHFVGLVPYRRGIGECAIEYWKNIKDQEGNPLFVLLMGVTPEDNAKARKMSRLMQFREVGVMPSLCYLADQDRFIGGVITYRELRKEHNNGS